MARAVLASVVCGIVLGGMIAGGAVCMAQGPAILCLAEGTASLPADAQAQVQQLQQTVEAGPFYQKLLQRFGKPETCRAKTEGTSVALSYVFAHDAKLEAKIDSAIEYSEQRVDFNGLDRKAALELLKKGAADAFGDHGCGVEWGKPAEEPVADQPEAHANVYRGSSCNCQARMIFRGKAVAGLMVSSSC